jgi:hypothetical protein
LGRGHPLGGKDSRSRFDGFLSLSTIFGMVLIWPSMVSQPLTQALLIPMAAAMSSTPMQQNFLIFMDLASEVFKIRI